MMQLERKAIYKEIQPVALTNQRGLEATISSYDDALCCLNLLAARGVYTEIEGAYLEASILYMYDIIDTLATRLSHADAERFKS